MLRVAQTRSVLLVRRERRHEWCANGPTGHLTGAAGTGLSATYPYDAAGERLSKTVNSQTVYSLRSPDGHTLSEYASGCDATTWLRGVIYATGAVIGAVRARHGAADPRDGECHRERLGAHRARERRRDADHARRGALGCAVSAYYATADGTATAADCTPTSGTVTFASGAASGSRDVRFYRSGLWNH